MFVATHVGLHVTCPLMSTDINENWSIYTTFSGARQYKNSWKSIHRYLDCYMWTDNTVKLTRTFLNFLLGKRQNRHHCRRFGDGSAEVPGVVCTKVWKSVDPDLCCPPQWIVLCRNTATITHRFPHRDITDSCSASHYILLFLWNPSVSGLSF
jgi:hypothetical protein